MLLTVINTLRAPADVPVRRETLDGRPHLVVPMAMMEEGVWDGSDGPVLYTNQELDKSVPTFDHKPIVVYHPMMDGKPISACKPDVLNAQKIGVVLNTVRDSKLRAEAWLDEERTRATDARILQNVENGRVTEISTGLFSTPNKDTGVWNAKQYTSRAIDIRADHLAVLPDKVGAYSVASGAGLLRVNELSFSDIETKLNRAVAAKVGEPGEYWCGWVEDVFTDKVVYWDDGTLYEVGYTTSAAGVALTGSPVKVVRVTEYQTAAGTVIGNARVTLVSNLERCHMDKKARVDALIGNATSGWVEADRDFLMKQDDPVLDKFVKVKPVEVQAPSPAPTANAAPVVTPAPEVKKPLTVNEYLAAAPADVKEFLTEGINSLTKQRTSMIEKITANGQNRFKAEELAQMTTPTLERIAELAAPPAVAAVTVNGYPFPGGAAYTGAAGGPTPTANAAPSEPMAKPTV